MHRENGMGTSNSDPYPTTEAASANNNIRVSAAPPHFCTSLKVGRLTGTRLQGVPRTALAMIKSIRVPQHYTR